MIAVPPEAVRATASDAGEAAQQLLPAAIPPLSTSKATSELQTLRKRQSFNFGDNRLRPAMLTGLLQSDTQLPAQSGVALPAASDTASRPGVCAAPAAASLPASSLAAALMQSTDDSAADIPGETKPTRQLGLNPGMSGGKSKDTLPVASASPMPQAAETSDLSFTDSNRSSAAVTGLTAADRSRSSFGEVKGRAAARASPATAPAAASTISHSHTAVKPVKHAVPPKPGWQH